MADHAATIFAVLLVAGDWVPIDELRDRSGDYAIAIAKSASTESPLRRALLVLTPWPLLRMFYYRPDRSQFKYALGQLVLLGVLETRENAQPNAHGIEYFCEARLNEDCRARANRGATYEDMLKIMHVR
ncbi:MAG TPA: hypothetical protein VJL39_00905 [Candidatus Paceibacterota bacterium]